MGKHRIWYGVILVVSAIIFLAADNPLSLFLPIGLLLIPVVSAAVQVLAMRDVEMDCEIQDACYVDREVSFRLRLEKANRIPLGAIELELQIENILYGLTEVRTVLLQPSEKKSQMFLYEIFMSNCGNKRITIQKVRYFDLMGLFCWNRRPKMEARILVYPPRLHVQIQLHRRPETEMEGDLYDPYRKGQDVSEVSGLRAYADGDSLGSIHWKLSGKMDELIVRELGYPSNYHTVILYELTKPADERDLSNRQNNAVLALTSSVSRSMLERNLDHVVVNVRDGECQSVPVETLTANDSMLTDLLCHPVMERKENEDSLYYFLRSNLAHSYTKMIYITASYDEENARQISREMDLTILHVVDDKEVDYITVQGYSVIPVESDHYAQKRHSIVI